MGLISFQKIALCRMCWSRYLRYSTGLPTDTYEPPSSRTMPITRQEQKDLLKLRPASPANSRLLKVAIIGTPNAGKSTLANKLIGSRYSAVSKKIHTTRHKVVGVLTEADTQIVFLDTPGMTVPWRIDKKKMERSLLTDPHSVLMEADLIAVVVDVAPAWNRTMLDKELMKALYLHRDKEAVLILNKVDLLKHKKELLNITRNLTNGIVGNTVSWRFDKADPAPSVAELFANMEKRHSAPHPASDSEQNRHDDDQQIIEKKHTVGDPNDNDSKIFSDVNDKLQVSALDTDADSSLVVNENNEDAALDTSSSKRETDVMTIDGQEIEIRIDDYDNEMEGREVGRKHRLNLVDEQNWHEYEKILQVAEDQIKDLNGWPGFSNVFMTSATETSGVQEIVQHLLLRARPAKWDYHSSVITSQDPVEIARMTVWEKLLDNLPSEIPYEIDIKLVSWVVDSSNMLRAQFDLVCSKKRFLYHTLGRDGSTIKRIAAEAKQELMNTFKMEMSLQLAVRASNELKISMAKQEKIQRRYKSAEQEKAPPFGRN